MLRRNSLTVFQLLVAIFFTCQISPAVEAAYVFASQMRGPASPSRDQTLPLTYHKIWLHRVSNSLPVLYPIHGDEQLRHQYHQFFAQFRPTRLKIEQQMRSLGNLRGSKIAALFKPGVKYTYVILDGEFIFTEVRKDRPLKYLSKHFTAASFADAVRYAGECWLGPNGSLVIDNNSGTYRPDAAQLSRAARLLHDNLELSVHTQAYNSQRSFGLR